MENQKELTLEALIQLLLIVILEYRLREPMLKQEVLKLRESSSSIKSPWTTVTLSLKPLKTCLITFNKTLSNLVMVTWLVQILFKWKINQIFFNKLRTLPMLSKIIYLACSNKSSSNRESSWLRSHKEAPHTISATRLLHRISLRPTSHFWINQCQVISLNITTK